MSVVPMFDPVRFRSLLGRAADAEVGAEPPPIGETALWLATAGTTQEEARALARRGAPHGTIVLAEEQNAGRGRRGRTWISPPGAGIWATVILRDPLGPEGPHWLTLAAAVAVCEAARELGASAAEIKWPNDLIAGGRKFGGVIGELMPAEPRTGRGGRGVRGGTAGELAPSAAGSVALLGLGVNLELDPHSLPAPMSAATTSLRAEGLSPLAGTRGTARRDRRAPRPLGPRPRLGARRAAARAMARALPLVRRAPGPRRGGGRRGHGARRHARHLGGRLARNRGRGGRGRSPDTIRRDPPLPRGPARERRCSSRLTSATRTRSSAYSGTRTSPRTSAS